MALRCESCGADNPNLNRYCGQCGSKLPASDASQEFWRGGNDEKQPNHVEAAASLPPEVIDFDNKIPLIADNRTDRRLHPPPEVVEQLHDHLNREAEMHDELRHGSQSHSEVLAEQDAERERIRDHRSDYLRWDTNSDSKDDPSNVAAEDANIARDNPAGNALFDVAAERAETSPPAHHNFLEEGARTTGTGVSGPSFLGLTEDRVPEYVDEEPEPESHLRRNVALAILVAAIALGAAQWRSIRDYGLAYVQNGSMQVKKAVKGAPQNPPAVAADNTSRDLGMPPATPNPGAPSAVESSPNANQALPVQPTASSSQPGDANPAASAKPSKTETPTRNAPVAAAHRSKPPAVVSHSATKARRPPPPSARDLARTPRAKPVSGADEMNHAASASDAEARAAWLWKAVSKGNSQAPIELAKMYERGTGVVRSCDQAEVLLRSAAAKGNAQAKINLQQIRARGGCSSR